MGLTVILLNNSKIQRCIADGISAAVEDATGGKLEIGGLRLRLPHRVKLEEVVLTAPSEVRVAAVKEATAYVRLLPLLRGEVNVKEVSVQGFEAHVDISPDSVLNIQWLIDALRSDKEVAVPDLVFPTIVIEEGRLRFTDRRGKLMETENVFNAKDIEVSELNTEVSLRLRKGNEAEAAIVRFGCREKSGFRVENITARVMTNDTSIVLEEFTVALPQTFVRMDSAMVTMVRDERSAVDWKRATVDMSLTDTKIFLPDFKAFAPQLQGLKEFAYLSTEVRGRIGNLQVGNLQARYGGVISMRATIDVNGLPDYKQAFYYCNIDHITFDKNSLQDLAANISGRPFELPKDVSNLGLCRYSGNVTGFLSNMVLYGNLRTDIGSVKTDVSVKASENLERFQVEGKIASENLQIQRILPKAGLKDVAFSTRTKLVAGRKGELWGNADLRVNQLTYNDYRYQNIEINGEFTKKRFAGRILVDDPNCYLSFDGMMSNENRYNNCEFALELGHFKPHRLNLMADYEELEVSGAVVADFEGSDVRMLKGFLSVDSLHILNGEGKEFLLPRLLMESAQDSVSSVSITSDIVRGSMKGRYNLARIRRDLTAVLAEKMPIAAMLQKGELEKRRNEMGFSFEIEPLYPLFSTLDIPWYTTETANIQGRIDTDNSLAEGMVSVPCLTDGKKSIDSIMLTVDNYNTVAVSLCASTKVKAGRLNAGVNIDALADTVLTTVYWDNHADVKQLTGEVSFSTALSRNPANDSITARIDILPREMVLQDKRWMMHSGSILTDLTMAAINEFELRSEDGQLVAIDGLVSPKEDGQINVILNDISLDYISSLIPEETAISFGGRVSGFASVNRLLQQPEILAEVHSEGMMFDGAYFGKVDADCHFDHESTSLVFGGDITADDGTHTGRIDGSYSFTLDSLDLKAHADGIDLRFIDFYTADIFGHVTGYAYGDVHVYGITKTKKVAVDVDALAKDASVSIDFLNNTFYFTDSIHLDRTVFDFGTIDITDKFGNHGTLKGAVYHDYFNDFVIDLNVAVNNMLVLNTTKADSESFYGTAYGTGNVRISGDEKTLRIVCKARSEAGTTIYIPIDSDYASENSFITFVSHDTEKTEAKAAVADDEESSTNIVLDIMIDVTPSATVQLLIDSKSGDMLHANGSGSLRVTYDINEDDMKLYGTYQLESGAYLFTFQNLLRKEFKIKEGSSIVWTGDPLDASINIDAYYQLTADLAEILDESILTNAGRTSVPVQCLLNLSGILTQPTVKFDLRLPNSDEELNRALKNAVSTDEQMNRQIVSLLILNKFISNDQMATNTVLSQNELFSVVSSTLSSQLNNWASQMFDNWGFGVNFRTSGEGDTRSNEYEFNFQYSPTKRWEISGNVGYRDDNMSSNPFIGDFDVTYKLIESGKLQAKAYTHTNDYREFKKGLTTQGVGLVYSESFNSIPELVQGWKSSAERAKKERKIRHEQQKAKQQARKAEREILKAEKEAKKAKAKAQKKAEKAARKAATEPKAEE